MFRHLASNVDNDIRNYELSNIPLSDKKHDMFDVNQTIKYSNELSLSAREF